MRFRNDELDLGVVRPVSGGFPRHSHDEYVISVNIRGRERVWLDRRRFDVGTEEVTVYNPGEVQASTAQVDPGTSWVAVSLYVTAEALRSWTGADGNTFGRPVVHAPDLRAVLLDAARADGRGHDPAATAERLTLLVLELLGRAGRPVRQQAAGAGPEPGDRRLSAVLDLLRADLSVPVRVADVAAEVGLSREQLIRWFTRATGCPPYAWQLQARLAEGRRLLRRGSPVADVAHRLGFADQPHFAKHFRAAYATTPGRYRRGADPAPAGVNF